MLYRRLWSLLSVLMFIGEKNVSVASTTSPQTTLTTTDTTTTMAATTTTFPATTNTTTLPLTTTTETTTTMPITTTTFPPTTGTTTLPTTTTTTETTTTMPVTTTTLPSTTETTTVPTTISTPTTETTSTETTTSPPITSTTTFFSTTSPTTTTSMYTSSNAVQDCGDPTPTYGFINSSDTSYKSVVEVFCVSGYILNGSSTIICQTGGSWSDYPTCERVDCGQVPPIANGFITLVNQTDTTYGALANVTCNTGYESNTSMISCMENGTWEFPVCQAIDCGSLPAIDFGILSLDDPYNTTYGASASVSCSDGFETDTSTVVCLESGVWENASCTAKDCGALPVIDFGIITLDNPGNTTYGASAAVDCSVGFETDSPVIFCLESGVWKNASCTAKDCGTPPPIDFGIVTLDEPGNTTYGASASVICSNGFETDTSVIFCLESGVWENDSCTAKDCGTLPAIDFGIISLDDSYNTTYGASASVNCSDGFEADTSTIVCLESGVWENASCTAKDCGTVQNIDFGMITLGEPGNTTYGAFASVNCSEGFEADTSVIVCLETGTWENATCSAKDCGTVPVIDFGLITLDEPGNTTYGAFASVNCSVGFEADVYVIACLESGIWENTTCAAKDCGLLPTIDFGTITLDDPGNSTYGASASVNCSDGFETDTSVLVCLESGIWENASCTAKDCGTLPVIDSGIITLDYPGNTTYGASASVSCSDGFDTNTSVIFCLESGVWENTTCSAKDCGTLPVIDFGIITLNYPGNTTFGASATVNCSNGFESNTSVIFCLESGVWENATCSAKDCGPLPTIDFGMITLGDPGNTTYGASAFVNCSDGLETDTTVLVCLDSGIWENATCTAKECGTVPDIDFGMITLENPGNTTYGSFAFVNCSDGFQTNISVIVCLESGVWENATCNAKDCGTVPTIGFGIITLDDSGNTTYGASASVNCSDGFESDVSVIVCQESGVWESATCTAKDCGSVPIIEFGTIALDDPTNSTYGASASVNCSRGFKTNTSTIYCLASGVWDSAVCTAQDCGSVPTIAFGTIGLDDHTNSTYGASAFVNCSRGFKTNTSAIYCLASGVWDSSVCTAKDCGPIPVIDFGTITLDNLANSTYGASASVSCIDGFEANNSTILCLESGFWESATCTSKDCGNVPVIDNGRITPQNTQNTTYGATANVSCNTGFNTTTATINCTANGTWQIPLCKIIDCGNLTKAPANGSLVPLKSTTYKSIATYTCKTGYQIVGNATRQCLANATWNSVMPTCKIRDCGSVSAPLNGRIVNTTVVTTYNAKIVFACNDGYLIVGESSIVCLSSGKWSGATPSCYKQKPKTCAGNTDSRGTFWPETPVMTTAKKPCQEDFEGNVTRYCNADEIWQLPQYRCVRKAVEAVSEKVNSLTDNATPEEVNEALQEIIKVTTTDTTTTNTSQKLTDGELTALATSLEKVANVISVTAAVDDNITDSFIESASNLIDTSNQDSWRSLSATNDNGAGKVLAAVESIGTALARSLKNSPIQKKLIVKKNLALEVEKVSKNKSISFPSPESVNASTEDTKWIAKSQSKITLEPAALKDENTVYLITAVMYRDISEILPSKTTNNSSGDSVEEPVINGPVLSLSILPEVRTLNPPVTITFEHYFLNLSDPLCAYWESMSNSWSTVGCILSKSNDSFTTCNCSHLTNFAVLMSPFQQADASSKALRIISMVGICISILCLIITLLVHFILWRYLRNDRTTALMNLCIALLLGYALFLGGVDRTENRVACIAIAAMLHYIFLVVFSVMLVEGILIAVTVLYVFKTQSRVKVLLTLAWIVPAVIVGISLGATRTSGYGNENFCWLSSEKGVKWAFVGPSAFIILFNIICLLLVIRALFGTKAMETKKLAEKVKTSLRSLGVLVPLMGVSWIVGIFYVNDSFYFIQYIFAALNSLQGFFIFLFHCLLNEQVKRSIGLKVRRKSPATWLKSSVRSTSREYKSAKDLREPDKSYLDDNSKSQDWRDKVLENAISSSEKELDFASPMQVRGPRRLAVAFGPDVRGSLSGTLSREETSGSRSESRVTNESSKGLPRDLHLQDYPVDRLSLKRTEDFYYSTRL